MPLDPMVKAFLDKAAALPRPKVWDVPLPMMRQSFAGMMQITGPKDVPVGRVDNFNIPGPGGDIRARSYAPVAASGPLPVLIYFHGGGFVSGSLESHDGLCRLFAAEGGFKVIAVDYRLAPEYSYPAPVDDAWAAVQWIEANATSLGVDAGRVAVGGDSAGGTLAAVVTQMAKEKGGAKIAFQLLMFPNTQIGGETASMHEFAVGYFLERRAIEYFYGLYAPSGVDRNAPGVSPLKAKDFSGLPPAYVMLGGYDPLHDEGLAYAEKLRAAGVKVTIADYAGLVHCFIYLQTVLPQAHDAVAKAAKAVRAALDAA
ncbi:MAG TPA: alpha/beta hydrolase [Rhizomicrobium sp.]|jgi:acetyl esterase